MVSSLAEPNRLLADFGEWPSFEEGVPLLDGAAGGGGGVVPAPLAEPAPSLCGRVADFSQLFNGSEPASYDETLD